MALSQSPSPDRRTSCLFQEEDYEWGGPAMGRLMVGMDPLSHDLVMAAHTWRLRLQRMKQVRMAVDTAPPLRMAPPAHPRSLWRCVCVHTHVRCEIGWLSLRQVSVCQSRSSVTLPCGGVVVSTPSRA